MATKTVMWVFLGVGVLGALYFLLAQTSSVVEEPRVEVRQEKMVASSTEETLEAQDMSAEIVSQDSEPVAQNGKQYVGVHIMANGDIMDSTGTVYADAVILENGTVRMGDGTLIEDVPDLRPKNTAPVTTPKVVTVDVVGTDFAYDIKQIKVKKGDTVTINFRSDEGFHDFVVDEFDAATERVNDGESTSVTFVADKVGTFQYYCSVMNHRGQGMVGYLVVE